MSKKISKKLVLVLITVISLANVIGCNQAFAVVDEAGIFITHDIPENDRNIAFNAAYSGLEKLGYNITDARSYCETRDDILYFIEKPNKNYCFYFRGHANYNVITAHQNTAEGRITTDDITGYWHLVVLAGCSTGQTTDWADAFRVSSGSNKAFLGYYQTVTISNNTEWNRLFWNYVGDMNLRQAALEATEFTDVAGSVPIRMYGDKTWWGWAWDTN